MFMKIIWAILAIVSSLFWGVYGLNYEKREKEEEKNANTKISLKEYWKKDPIETFGIFFSEFIGSFAGWCCLYILAIRLRHSGYYESFGSADIFLTIGAVVGMAGYSYKIADLIENFKNKVGKEAKDA